MTTVLAHATPGHAWHHWAGEPQIVAALVVLFAAYGAGQRRLRRFPARRRWEAASFAAGGLVLAAALISPLESLAGALLSAHMAQHVLLVGVAPPLLLLGRPGLRLRLALPRWALVGRTRRRARQAIPPALRAIPPGGSAALAVVAHVAVLWAWHVPVPYHAAVRQPAVHAVEHAMLLGTALWFWSTVLRLHRRAAHPWALLALFAVGAAGAALGVLLTFSGRVAYPVHAAHAPAWGLTALEDQQIAAVGMWMGGGMAYVLAAVVVASRWLASAAGGPR